MGKNTPIEVKQKEKKDALLSYFFSFTLPPENLVTGTYIIQDPQFILETGYHQTSTVILLTEPPSGHILVPAVEIVDKCPILDTNRIFVDGPPITHALGRLFAVWWRRQPLQKNRLINLDLHHKEVKC